MTAPTQPAGEVVGRRIGAGLIDVAVLAVVFVVMGLLFGQSEAHGGHASVNLHGAGAIAFLVVALAYYFVMESLRGATLGKALLGIRVTGRDGAPATTGAIAVRTLLRLVDALPFLYLLGLIVMLVTPGRRRIGDLAAGTSVVAAR
jgi:uncharacterized RDD family membrane protein YckC